MYTYKVEVTRVVDGDTVDVRIDLGFGVWLHDRVRFFGVDAPETRTRDLQEKELGLKTKEYVVDKLALSKDIILVSKEFNKGKYGRILGDLLVDGKSLVEELLEKNLVEVYK